MILFSCPICNGTLAADDDDVDAMVECEHCRSGFLLHGNLVAERALEVEKPVAETLPQLQPKRSRTGIIVILICLVLAGLLTLRSCNPSASPSFKSSSDKTQTPEPFTLPPPQDTTPQVNDTAAPAPTRDPLSEFRTTIAEIAGTYTIVVKNTENFVQAKSTQLAIDQSLSKTSYRCGVVPDDTINTSSYNVVVYGFRERSTAYAFQDELFKALGSYLGLTFKSEMPVEMLYK
jgi:hypothetical protein